MDSVILACPFQLRTFNEFYELIYLVCATLKCNNWYLIVKRSGLAGLTGSFHFRCKCSALSPAITEVCLHTYCPLCNGMQPVSQNTEW